MREWQHILGWILLGGACVVLGVVFVIHGDKRRNAGRKKQ